MRDCHYFLLRIPIAFQISPFFVRSKSGAKTFVTGTVLTSLKANGYPGSLFMQKVLNQQDQAQSRRRRDPLGFALLPYLKGAYDHSTYYRQHPH